MINRYQGNSGRYTRIEDSAHDFGQSVKPRPPEADIPRERKNAQGRQNTRPAQPAFPAGGILEKLFSLISGSAQSIKPESEDIILMLILYLMYKESGDSELLIILGAMFLM